MIRQNLSEISMMALAMVDGDAENWSKKMKFNEVKTGGVFQEQSS